jgi:hypothetical protein
MVRLDDDQIEDLRRRWTDQLVVARTERPELARFAGRVGRVVTVNRGGKAIIDFGDGAWYDVPAADDWLTSLAADDPRRTSHDATANSAQPFPGRQS